MQPLPACARVWQVEKHELLQTGSVCVRAWQVEESVLLMMTHPEAYDRIAQADPLILGLRLGYSR